MPPVRPNGKIRGIIARERCRAVHLAQFHYLGETPRLCTATAHLDLSKMEEIKELFVAKFAAKQSLADKEELWRAFRVAIGSEKPTAFTSKSLSVETFPARERRSSNCIRCQKVPSLSFQM
jgi:hypothetical protein